MPTSKTARRNRPSSTGKRVEFVDQPTSSDEPLPGDEGSNAGEGDTGGDLMYVCLLAQVQLASQPDMLPPWSKTFPFFNIFNQSRHQLTQSRIDPDRMGKIYGKFREEDPWPERFSRTIKERKEGILKRLEVAKEERSDFLYPCSGIAHFSELTAQSSTSKEAFEAEFAPLLKRALGGIAAGHESLSTGVTRVDHRPPLEGEGQLPIRVQYLGAEGQPYCDGLISLMRQSHALLVAHDELSAHRPQESRLHGIGADFNKDKEVALATIEAGRRVAGADMENLLADRFQDTRNPPDLTAEEIQTGRMLLSRGANKDTPMKEPVGWGRIARDTERAVEKLCFAGQTHFRDS